MSHRIQTSFTCSLCESENHVDIPKPKPLQFTVAWAKCEVCESKFLMKFMRVKGDGFQMKIDSIKVLPTKEGERLFFEREKPVPATEQTKGV